MRCVFMMLTVLWTYRHVRGEEYSLPIDEGNSVGDLMNTSRIPDARFLHVFSVVRFPNMACSAGRDTGTCYTRWQCLLHGGSPQGICAQGLGVCCVTKLNGCGILFNSLNTTYLQSPGYGEPYTTAGTCTYIIKLNEDICQVRLDIDRLQLSPPNTQGVCVNDYLDVSQGNTFDRLCGTTVDSHLYLSVDPASSRLLTFTINVAEGVEFQRRWKIRVTQICCDQESMAPEGCGQYYTEPSGIIKGINYDGAFTDNQYLSGLNYAICVRSGLDTCSTTYTEPRYFLPQCGDTFERPSYDRTRGGQTTAVCCTADTNCPVILDYTNTVDLLGPHYFYLSTNTDPANTHYPESQGVVPFNYYMTYQQNACV